MKSAPAGHDEGMAAFNRGDYAAALREWHALADRGNADAQHNLGVMYGNGRGVARDYSEAATWYRLAAEQGHALAQRNLSYLYANGLGVSQDDVEAAKWCRLAADRGHADAQYILGDMYEIGLGVPRDYVQAHKWFDLAAASFSASAPENRDFAVESRDELASQMTPAQIAEAQRLAREWKPQ